MTEPFQYNLETAKAYFQQETPTVADFVTRRVLEQNPLDPRAWHLLSRIAGAAGQPDFSGRYHAVASALDLAREVPRENRLEPLEHATRDPKPDRYLLIKAWGAGFCSDVDHVLGALLLAELCGRTPVIHWGGNSLFSDDPGQDAFRSFFKPLNELTVDDLASAKGDIWPPKWTAGNLRTERLNKYEGPYSRVSELQILGRAERVVVSDFHVAVPALIPWLKPGHPLFQRPVEDAYRYLLRKYVHLTEALEKEVREFAESRFQGAPVIAVHIRGADKLQEDPELARRLEAVPRLLDDLGARNPATLIFLMTDSVPAVESFKKSFGDRLILTDCTRTSSTQGIHLAARSGKSRLGMEVVRDVYIAARCQKFLGIGSSNVSCMVLHLKEWGAQDLLLMGAPLNHQVSPFTYMSFEQLERYYSRDVVAKIRNYRK